MKRCGIVVLYNEDALIASYVEILLKSIKEILHKLVIVVNGDMQETEKEKLCRYTPHIFYRKNIGYDGGAYKDVFLKYLKEEDWEQWDEILLMNDTFYGPFFSWSEIFGDMEEANCDFWGLTHHPGGREKFLDGEEIAPHIQSYFIVVRKRMFLSPYFLDFWISMPYPKTLKEAIKNFEISFSAYFTEKGFSYGCWTEKKKEQLEFSDKRNVCGMENMVMEWQFPIYKRKSYMLSYYIIWKRFLEYLSKESDYPVEVIQEDIMQRCRQDKVRPYNPEQIRDFCRRFHKIYLYGKGNYAENIESFLSDNGINVSGYIISNKKEDMEYVYEFDKFQVEPDMGIIVALSEKHLKEIYPSLKTRVSDEQMILPQYD